MRWGDVLSLLGILLVLVLVLLAFVLNRLVFVNRRRRRGRYNSSGYRGGRGR